MLLANGTHACPKADILRRLGGVGFVPEPDIVGPSARHPTKEFFNDVLFAPTPEDGQAKGTRSCALGSQTGGYS